MPYLETLGQRGRWCPSAGRALPLLAPLSLALAVGAAKAQAMTPAQFAEACAANPSNVVTLAESLKLQSGSSGTTFAVPAGCTVVLAKDASLELDTITFSFGGPFVLLGGEKSAFVLDKATLTAPTVDLSLTGVEGRFEMNEARLAATSGDLWLRFGIKGKLEVKNSGGWYQPRLSARGRLNLNTGAQFGGTVVQSGLQGASGMAFAFGGADSSFKIEKSDLLLSSGASNPGTYRSGAFQVSSAASKVAFELIDVNLMEASRAVTVTLDGPESKLGLLSVRSQTLSRRISLTALGSKGEVKVENPLLQGSPEVVIESGPQGSTTVKTAPGTISASERIRIRAGTNGSCSANTQGLIAPVLQVCQ